jgi:methyl coenzyme M reductase alpha subunit
LTITLEKSYILLIKDIPFVTNISKYYNKDILDLNYNYLYNLQYSNNLYSINNKNQNIDKINSNTIKSSNYSFNYYNIKYGHITDTIHSSNRIKCHEDEFMKSIQAQSNYNIDDSISKNIYNVLEN